jgi:flagellar protein FliO/FliZ
MNPRRIVTCAGYGSFVAAFGFSLPAGAAESSAPIGELGGHLVQAILGLAVVLAVLIVGLKLIKRLSHSGTAVAGQLRVLGGAAVGPRERVVLVEIGETWLVLGVAPGRVNSLHALPRRDTAVPSIRPPAGGDFQSWLARLMERDRAP